MFLDRGISALLLHGHLLGNPSSHLRCSLCLHASSSFFKIG